MDQGLGTPGQTSDPRVIEAGRTIMRKTAVRGIPAAGVTNSLDHPRRWRETGLRYLCYSVDTVLLLNWMRRALDEIQRRPRPQ